MSLLHNAIMEVEQYLKEHPDHPLNGTVEILKDEDETLSDILKTYQPPEVNKTHDRSS